MIENEVPEESETVNDPPEIVEDSGESNPVNRDEYAELVKDFRVIARRGIEDFQEEQDGRRIEFTSLYMQGRYGVVVRTDERGIPVIQATDIDEDSKGVQRNQRFFMGGRAEASTKDHATKSVDFLGRLDTTVKGFDISDKSHKILKDTIEESQKKGEKKQRDLDENDKKYFPPVVVEGADNSIYLGYPDRIDLNVMKRLVVLGRQTIKQHLGAKLDKVDVVLYCIQDSMEYADTQGNGVDTVVSMVGFSVDVKTKDGSRAFGSIRGTGGGLDVLKRFEDKPDDVTYEDVIKKLASDVAKEASDLDKAQGAFVVGSSCPVLFSPLAAGVFTHESLGHPMESDIILENKEAKTADINLKARIGGQVSENQDLCIIDIGDSEMKYGSHKIRNMWGATPVDDNGTISSTTELVKNGVQVGALVSRYDLNELTDGLKEDISKSMRDRGLTGNVRSEDYSKEPLVRMTNTIMLPKEDGAETIEELAAKVPANKKGLYVATCMGGWVEPDSGDFQIIAGLCYLIENGQIVWRKPIKDARVNGNITKLNIKEIGGSATSDKSFTGYCHPAGTPIVTANGIKSIEDIKIGDMVLTHKGRFRPVVNTMNRLYSGKLYTFRTLKDNRTITTTEDHPLYISKKKARSSRILNITTPKWIEAGNIEVGDFVAFPEFKVDDDNTYWSEEEAEFLGIYLAEGYLHYHEDTPYSIEMEVKTDSDVYHKIIELANKLYPNKLKVNDRKDRNISTLSLHDVDLCKKYAEFGRYSHGKTIPSRYLCQPIPILSALIRGFRLGDGYTLKDGGYVLCTISNDLVTAFKFILGRMGLLPSIYISTESKGSYSSNYPLYKIEVYPQNRKEWDTFMGYYFIPIKNIKVEDVTDVVVYNLTVEDDHSYMHPAFTVSNCGKSGQWVRTEGRGPAILLEDAKIVAGGSRYFVDEYRDFIEQLRKVNNGEMGKEEVYFDSIGEILDERDKPVDDIPHHTACMVVAAMDVEDEINYLIGRRRVDIGGD